MDHGQPIEYRRVRWLLCLVAGMLLGLTTPAAAQPLSHEFVKDGARFRAAFKPLVQDARQSVVRILNDEKAVSLGVIVSDDGLILTKASEVHGETVVQLPDDSEYPASLVGIDRTADLALLRIAATDLRPIEWSNESLPVGSWLTSVGPGELPVGVGIVGVAQRDIPAQRGMLGIELGAEESNGRPMVMGVYPGSGAERAGLQEGDVIASVSGESVPDRQALLDRLAKFRPGESVTLLIRRGEEDEKVQATLGSVESIIFNRQSRQNTMAGPLSTRSGGFEDVVQHDTFLNPKLCGGPVVDLEGRVVGINIARAGRVETYALPTRSVLPIIERLRKQQPQTAQVAPAQP